MLTLLVHTFWVLSCAANSLTLVRSAFIQLVWLLASLSWVWARSQRMERVATSALKGLEKYLVKKSWI